MLVDSNYLRNPVLHDYLGASASNFIVLADFVAMEAYKQNTVLTLSKTFAIAADYPRQVIVLKSSGRVAGLSARNAGLQRRMIDQSQTNGFPKFLAHLRHAAEGDAALVRELTSMGAEAATHFNTMLDHVPSMLASFSELAKQFSPEERAVIREQGRYPPQLITKLMAIVEELLTYSLKNRPHPNPLPTNITIRNLLVCRVSLCFSLLIVRWIEDGQQMKIRPERFRNDAVDMYLAAYSTYFDGILSSDKKLSDIAVMARYVLQI